MLIDGERIGAVGQVGQLRIPPGAEVISTEGHDRAARAVGHARALDARRPFQLRPLAQHLSRSLRHRGHAGGRHAVCCSPGSPVRASSVLHSKRASAFATGSTAASYPAPTLYVTGPFLQHEPYPGTERYRWGIDGAADARAKVRRLAEAGVRSDQADRPGPDDHGRGARQSSTRPTNHDLLVIAHSHRPEEIRRGIAAGVDNFEHTGLGTMPEYPCRRLRADEVARQHSVLDTDHHAHCCSTSTRATTLSASTTPAGRPACRRTSSRTSRSRSRTSSVSTTTSSCRARRPTLQRKFEQLRTSGVVMLIGTDSGVPLTFHSGLDLARSSTCGVNHFGVEPMQAIQAATYWPAVAQKVIDEVGTVSRGQAGRHRRRAWRRAPPHRPLAGCRRGDQARDGATSSTGLAVAAQPRPAW